MNVLRIKKWARIIICYWLIMSVVFYFEFKYMQSDWAGLPGFLLTLPLSLVVVVVGFTAEYLAGRYGYNLHVTDYQYEYGLIVCAVANVFIWYPVYALWAGRKSGKSRFDTPPPPPEINSLRGE